MSRSCQATGLGPNEPRDCRRSLTDLLGGSLVPGSDRVRDAMTEVIFQQADRDGLQRLRDGRDLGQDVDAIGIVVDHPLQPAYLSLDAPQPRTVLVLVLGVAVQPIPLISPVAIRIPGRGMLCSRRR